MNCFFTQENSLGFFTHKVTSVSRIDKAVTVVLDNCLQHYILNHSTEAEALETFLKIKEAMCSL